MRFFCLTIFVFQKNSFWQQLCIGSVLSCYWTGNHPLPEPKKTQFFNAIWHNWDTIKVFHPWCTGVSLQIWLPSFVKKIKVPISFSKHHKTRQHSTQSVGNMPPPSPPHLLPQVLQIMPRNPKYDQFQPKGHHNEENPQSTKCLETPNFTCFTKSK